MTYLLMEMATRPNHKPSKPRVSLHECCCQYVTCIWILYCEGSPVYSSSTRSSPENVSGGVNLYSVFVCVCLCLCRPCPCVCVCARAAVRVSHAKEANGLRWTQSRTLDCVPAKHAYRQCIFIYIYIHTHRH